MRAGFVNGVFSPIFAPLAVFAAALAAREICASIQHGRPRFGDAKHH